MTRYRLDSDIALSRAVAKLAKGDRNQPHELAIKKPCATEKHWACFSKYCACECHKK